MAKVQLLQRTGPQSRGAIPKVPMSLANTSGDQAIWNAVIDFSGGLAKNLVASQAANEEAEARGLINSHIEGYSTFVAANPNASPNELNKEWQRISSQIKKIPGTMVTGIASESVGRFVNANGQVFNQRAQTQMESVKSRQEYNRSEVQIEGFKNNLDDIGLKDHYENMVEAGTYNMEDIFGVIQKDGKAIGGRYNNEALWIQQEIEKLQIEQAFKGVEGQVNAIIDNGGTEDDGRAVINKAIKDGIIPADSKKSLYSSLGSYQNQVQNSRLEETTAINMSFTAKAQDFSLRKDDVNAAFPSGSVEDENWRNQWNLILQESQDPSKRTKTSTTDGMGSVMDSLAGIPNGSKTKNQVISDLTNQYYVENNINENDYQWALSQVDNPYPANVTKSLQKEFRYIDKNVDKWWSFSPVWETGAEEKRTRNTRQDLVEWVDGELAKERTPGPKEIHQKAAEFAVGAREPESEPEPLVTINTQEEYDALPKGTQYEDANGNKGTKR